VTPTLHVELDADAWTTLEDRRKGERFFEAVDLLATAVDVTIVAGDDVREVLAERFGEWADRHDLTDDLTDSRDTSRQPARDESEENRLDAYRTPTRSTVAAGTGSSVTCSPISRVPSARCKMTPKSIWPPTRSTGTPATSKPLASLRSTAIPPGATRSR